MFNGGGEVHVQQQPAPSQSRHQMRRHAQIKIVEQPASKALRFRYECEGRSAGSIPGARSTPENKTFPTIQIVGYQGRAVVVVSCVTKDAPYRPHPHNLVGREGCKRGVCTLEIPADTMTVHFSNLGIQCVKKKDIEHALRIREEIRVDPFRTGFGHRNQPTSIDLNTVRLCFQVFLEGDTPGKFSVPLTPVVSEPIYDKKAMSDLSIVKLSDCVSYVDGGRKDVVLLCEKVAKEDIQVKFYDENGWEAYADFQPSQVHKQHAIWFRPPRYSRLDVSEPVKAFIQLRRPSDGAVSDALPFEFWPIESEPKRKNPKTLVNHERIVRELQEYSRTAGAYAANFTIDPVKSEPIEKPYAGGLCSYATLSPGVYMASPESMGPSSPQDIYSPQPPQWNVGLEGIAGPSNDPFWNISIAPSGSANMQENNLLNLDSGEIKRLVENTAMDSIAPLPDLNISFSDVVPSQDVNMTDSLTKMANMALDDIMNIKQ